IVIARGNCSDSCNARRYRRRVAPSHRGGPSVTCGRNLRSTTGQCVGDVPTMIRVIRICRNCGAKIFSDAPEGLCTGCVLEAALGLSSEPLAGVADAANEKLAAGYVAPASKKAAQAAESLGELGDYELLDEIGRGG